jgi:hypothetical protein
MFSYNNPQVCYTKGIVKSTPIFKTAFTFTAYELF